MTPKDQRSHSGPARASSAALLYGQEQRAGASRAAAGSRWSAGACRPANPATLTIVAAHHLGSLQKVQPCIEPIRTCAAAAHCRAASAHHIVGAAAQLLKGLVGLEVVAQPCAQHGRQG